ncbi:magnesium/cobalt transporter CorA [Melioribacteraceae bacterium 4301-Me]|uniref:magnesium/cobalt transporter CorA n=1 Tax=Pyranulibacter aquaticus TaxID=3163344 RepID=UPI00359A7A15
MSNRRQQVKSKIGKPPGSLIFVGEKNVDKTIITLVEYDQTEYECRKIESLDKLKQQLTNRKKEKVLWINVNGLQDVELISEIGSLFGIHPLSIEDVLNSYQRSKADFFENGIFIVAKNAEIKNNKELSIEQVSFFIGQNFVISFQHNPEVDTFNSIYAIIEKGKGIIRKSKADYLLYVLLDFLLDNYFLVVEELGEQIDDLQEILLKNPKTEELAKIQKLKKYLQNTRQTVSPLRELLNSLIRRDSLLITEETVIYFRDTLDHQIRIVENLETLRDTLTTMLDIYLSSVNNKMNEVMKVLTIIATIFIPLTFIVGIYGMNFQYMPELEWKFGYPLILFLMIVIAILLVRYFKKKNWF